MTSSGVYNGSVSVVIPCYNSTGTIRQCLSALHEQTRQPDEIIVVNSSQDDLLEICRSSFPTVKVIQLTERTSTGGAVNRGVREANGEIVAIIDSDCLAAPRWLELHLTARQRPEVHAVTGSLGPAPDEDVYLLVDRLLCGSHQSPAMESGWRPTGASGNFSVEKAKFENVGGFPEGFRINADFQFCVKLVEKYGPIWFEPAAEVAHVSLRNRNEESLISHQYSLGQCWANGRRACDRLSGAFVARHPFLAPALYPYRIGLLLWRYARYDSRDLRDMFRHSRLWLKAYSAWWKGLWDGLHEAGP